MPWAMIRSRGSRPATTSGCWTGCSGTTGPPSPRCRGNDSSGCAARRSTYSTPIPGFRGCRETSVLIDGQLRALGPRGIEVGFAQCITQRYDRRVVLGVVDLEPDRTQPLSGGACRRKERLPLPGDRRQWRPAWRGTRECRAEPDAPRRRRRTPTLGRRRDRPAGAHLVRSQRASATCSIAALPSERLF